MSDYSKSTNFTSKDTLPTGNAGKIVKGTELDIEFTAIASAVSSKANISSPDLLGTPTAPTATTGTNTTQIANTAFVTAAMQLIYPVGSIYLNASVSTNPATLLGFGTWTEFGAGKVIVGLNSADALFDTLEETGGSKDATLVSHTHAATSVVTDPLHNHYILESSGYGYSYANTGTPNQSLGNGLNDGGAASYLMSGPNSTSGQPKANFGLSSNTATGVTVATTNATQGASATNANLQPYIVVKMWKRTA